MFPQFPPKREPETSEPERTRQRQVYVPAVDILETNDAMILVADMPGVDESGVDITIEKNQLTIRGTPAVQAPPNCSPVSAEYGVGDYERTFTISHDVNRDGVQATIRDGVLRVTLPKARTALSTKVPVTAG